MAWSPVATPLLETTVSKLRPSFPPPWGAGTSWDGARGIPEPANDAPNSRDPTFPEAPQEVIWRETSSRDRYRAPKPPPTSLRPDRPKFTPRYAALAAKLQDIACRDPQSKWFFIVRVGK